MATWAKDLHSNFTYVETRQGSGWRDRCVIAVRTLPPSADVDREMGLTYQRSPLQVPLVGAEPAQFTAEVKSLTTIRSFR